MNIEDLPKGWAGDPEDERDFKIESVMGGAPWVDWSKEFRLPAPPDTDQGSADCCVGEACSKYHWQLKDKQYSVRHLFAPIALDYGAYGRDGLKRICTVGQETITELPDPNPKTAQNMRSKAGFNDSLASDDIEQDFFSVNGRSIDHFAAAIFQNKGIVFGVYGSNKGWANMYEPEPTTADWGHYLYGKGYHIHPDGQKCIIAASSWCNIVKEHHIRENYFNAGMVQGAYTLLPKGTKTMTNAKVIQVQGTPEKGIYFPATSEDGLITLMRVCGMEVPLTPERKLDWEALQIQGTLIINQ